MWLALIPLGIFLIGAVIMTAEIHSHDPK